MLESLQLFEGRGTNLVTSPLLLQTCGLLAAASCSGESLILGSGFEGHGGAGVGMECEEGKYQNWSLAFVAQVQSP